MDGRKSLESSPEAAAQSSGCGGLFLILLRKCSRVQPRQVERGVEERLRCVCRGVIHFPELSGLYENTRRINKTTNVPRRVYLKTKRGLWISSKGVWRWIAERGLSLNMTVRGRVKRM